MLLCMAACSGASDDQTSGTPDGGETRDGGPERDGGAFLDPCGCANSHSCEAGGCVAKDVIVVQSVATALQPDLQQRAVAVATARAVTDQARDNRPVLAAAEDCAVYGDGDIDGTHEPTCLDFGSLEIDLDGDVRTLDYACSTMFPGSQILQSSPLAPPGTPVTVRGAGGADIEPFTASLFIPDDLTVTVSGPIVPGQPLTVTWNGGDLGTIEVAVGAQMNGNSVFAECVTSDDGELEISGTLTAALPPGAALVLVRRFRVTNKQLVGGVLVTTASMQTFARL